MDFVAPTNEDVVRDLEFDFELARADGGDGLTLEGYAAVFNTPTLIDSWEGTFEEQIAPGAFKRSINARTPVMQFDHGNHPLVGSLPIAAIRRLREDAQGLYVQARVFDNWLTAPLRDAIREQAIKGMSFRFSVVRDNVTPAEERKPKTKYAMRTLQEVRLFELGPVVFPAYSETSVALRSLASSVPNLSALFGTSDEPAEPSTSDEPAISDDSATSHSRTRNQRRALALLSLKEKP